MYQKEKQYACLDIFYFIQPKSSHNASFYRCAPIHVGNTFQDLPWLRETANNIKHYIYHDIHVTNINTVKLN
jgi:hypothetical protein